MIAVADIAAAATAALAPGDRAWLVGGAVRDQLLHRIPADVDLAVDGDCEGLARRLAVTLEGSVFAFSERFLTWRVVFADGCVDLAPLRGESLDADLAARDFTVNAMARPVGGGDLIDPLGGFGDVRAGVLRACAAEAFTADPLRVLRLARFEGQLAMEAEAASIREAASAAPGLAGVSGERVEHELSLLLAHDGARDGVLRLDGLGALVLLLPELALCKGVTQNPYHHLPVFEHALEALDHLPQVVEVLGGQRYLATPDDAGLPGSAPLAPLAWAVLLHDIGKPRTRAVDDQGRVTFYHHDQVGAGMAVQIARRLRMSRRFCQYLERLIKEHLRLGFLVRDLPLSRRALVRYRRAVEPFAFDAIALSLSDRMATRGEANPPVSLARHFRIARDVFGDTPPPEPRRLLDGGEVMTLLGVPAGPPVGEVLSALQEEIDCGEITTPDAARAFVTAWWAARPDPTAGPST